MEILVFGYWLAVYAVLPQMPVNFSFQQSTTHNPMETLPFLTFSLSVGVVLSLSLFILLPFMRRLGQLKRLNYYISNQSELKALHTRLELLMLEQRPFLNAGFNQHSLAQQLSIPEAMLDCFLKGYLQTSFTQLVDAYRVQYACLMLQSEIAMELPMDTIAHASGFESRQNFFQSFRRNTGKTPVQYIRYLVFARDNMHMA